MTEWARLTLTSTFLSMTEWARWKLSWPTFLWWPSELGENWLHQLSFGDRVNSVNTDCYFFFDDRVNSVNTVCHFIECLSSVNDWYLIWHLCNIKDNTQLSIVSNSFQFSKPNLFSKSFKYLACEMRIPLLLCIIYNPRKKIISPIMLISNSFFMSFENLLLAS